MFSSDAALMISDTSPVVSDTLIDMLFNLNILCLSQWQPTKSIINIRQPSFKFIQLFIKFPLVHAAIAIRLC
jgi:hypothetical protein